MKANLFFALFLIVPGVVFGLVANILSIIVDSSVDSITRVNGLRSISTNSIVTGIAAFLILPQTI
jgi:hypothetical protein